MWTYIFQQLAKVAFQNLLRPRNCIACGGTLRLDAKLQEVWYKGAGSPNFHYGKPASETEAIIPMENLLHANLPKLSSGKLRVTGGW